jgi:chromosome segregation ATPase
MGKKKEEEMTGEKLKGQLNYAQKLINVLQTKLNDSNGTIVQLEAQIQIANEERESLLEQVKEVGIVPDTK